MVRGEFGEYTTKLKGRLDGWGMRGNAKLIGAKGKRSVLIVDDDVFSLFYDKTVLEKHHYAVFTAQSGTEAISMLAHIPYPDLILLDIRLGDMTGDDFLKLLEKTHPVVLSQIPVVFHSCMNAAPSATRAAGQIEKGLEIEDFVAAVGAFMDAGVGHADERAR